MVDPRLTNGIGPYRFLQINKSRRDNFLTMLQVFFSQQRRNQRTASKNF